ncbi:hypothetical protein D3C86_944350 [compost metagenome]
MRVASTSAADIGQVQSTLGAKPGGEWMVVEAEFTLVSGNLQGSALSFQPYTAVPGFIVARDINFFTEFGAGTVGRTYRVQKLLDGRSANTARYNLVLWTRRAAYSPVGAVTLDWRRASMRPANEQEIAAGVALPALSASVTEQSLAIIDLETGQALAKFELVAAASGGKPARFKLVSSSLGSAIALDAPWIYWGDNTVFDDATDTLQTTVGGRIRVMALGAPFGSAGNLLEWWGPTGIALSAMTTANGHNGRMTEAPYVFDNTATVGVSALRSTIGSNAGAFTTATFATIATAGFTSLPTGGTLRLYASALPTSGMSLTGAGVGTSLTGEVRVLQSGATIATGTMTAYVTGGDADAQIFLNNMTPVVPAQTGLTSLQLQWRSTTSGRNIGGTGAQVSFYADWTKNG